MTVDKFLEVTELSGDEVTSEQIERMERRYHWVSSFVEGRDVLELGCGTGQGAGLLQTLASHYVPSDTSGAMLDIARRYYGERIKFFQFDSQDIPLPDASLDVVVVCEALYYFSDVDSFFKSARRVLRPGGLLLIVTANKDLFDFNPSPHSHSYLGVLELHRALIARGFNCQFFGDTPLGEVPPLQRVLRPIKALASRAGLLPKTMAGKKLLKRLVFGELKFMPFELMPLAVAPAPPKPLSPDQADTQHKVIFCAAKLSA